MILFVIIYALSIMLGYRYVQVAHSEGGMYSLSKIDPFYLIAMLFPIGNTVCFIGLWIFYYPKYEKRFFNADKFFQVKR